MYSVYCYRIAVTCGVTDSWIVVNLLHHTLYKYILNINRNHLGIFSQSILLFTVFQFSHLQQVHEEDLCFFSFMFIFTVRLRCNFTRSFLTYLYMLYSNFRAIRDCNDLMRLMMIFS